MVTAPRAARSADDDGEPHGCATPRPETHPSPRRRGVPEECGQRSPPVAEPEGKAEQYHPPSVPGPCSLPALRRSPGTAGSVSSGAAAVVNQIIDHRGEERQRCWRLASRRPSVAADLPPHARCLLLVVAAERLGGPALLRHPGWGSPLRQRRRWRRPACSVSVFGSGCATPWCARRSTSRPRFRNGVRCMPPSG